MFINDGKQVIGVFVFTVYDNQTMDVTMTSPDKSRFEEVKLGIGKIIRWCKDTIKDGDKCPYSPDNPVKFRHEQVEDHAHMGS